MQIAPLILISGGHCEEAATGSALSPNSHYEPVTSATMDKYGAVSDRTLPISDKKYSKRCLPLSDITQTPKPQLFRFLPLGRQTL
jgi:hypothetical protein